MNKLVLWLCALSTLSLPATTQTASGQSIAAGQTTLQAAGALAQKPAPLPAFDVVSVKPHKPGTEMFRTRFMPDGFTIENTGVLFIIRQAFDLFTSNDDQITGLPAWANSDRYDIQAKVAEEDIPAYKVLTPQQRNLMLQGLLADRFKMVAHPVTRDAPVYALVIARGGSKLHESAPGSDGKIAPSGTSMGPAFIKGWAVPIAELLGLLTQKTGRTVIDKTGLTGRYDINLNWTSDASPATDGAPAGDAVAALFTALQEQLGLKLESQRAPVPGVVIDHIERPSEN